METITIRDVGPIFEHTLPVSPGVTILTGGNEAGKSTAIACVSKLAGRDVDLAVRDGAKSGIIDGLGTVVTVTGRKSSRAGEFDAESVEERIDLWSLVDPGMKDKAAATRKRIKAILSLTGKRLGLDSFLGILPGEMALQEILAEDISHDDPVETAGKIKRRMEAKAREFESKALNVEAQLNAKAQQYAGVDFDLPHDSDALGKELENAIEANAALKAQAEAAANDQQSREQARQLLAGAEAAVKRESDLKQKLDADLVGLKEATDKHTATVARKRELEDELARLEKVMLEQASVVNARADLVEQRESELKAAQEQTASLKSAQELMATAGKAGPSPDDLAASADLVLACRRAVEDGTKIREAIKAKEEHRELLTKYNALSESATLFRNAATSTDTVLSQAVDCETLKIVDGDLIYVEGDRKESYARLSDGKRCQVAICEVARAVSKGKKRLAVLPLPQEAFEGLERKNRDLIHNTAVECGIAIVTARIKDEGGPLTSTLYRSNGTNG